MLNATLVKRIEITPELLIFWVKPDAGIPNFLPGQYVALGLMSEAARPAHFPAETDLQQAGKLIKRAYSIGSSPRQKDYLEFYIAIAPTGALTSRLVCLQEGHRLYMAPKITGTFTLSDVPAQHNLVLISTGTGIAPFMAMLRTPDTFQLGRQITIIHGVRYASDLAYREELEAMARANSSFRYFAIVSRADESWKGERGYVQRFISEGKIILDAAHDHVFMCGNPAMIEDTQKILEAKGYVVHSRKTPGTLHLEKYW